MSKFFMVSPKMASCCSIEYIISLEAGAILEYSLERWPSYTSFLSCPISHLLHLLLVPPCGGLLPSGPRRTMSEGSMRGSSPSVVGVSGLRGRSVCGVGGVAAARAL